MPLRAPAAKLDFSSNICPPFSKVEFLPPRPLLLARARPCPSRASRPSSTLKTSPGTGSLRRRGRLNDRVPHHGIRCRPPLVTGTPVLSAKSEAYSTHCIGWQFVLEEDGNVCGSPIDGGLPPRPRTRQAAAPPRRRLTAIDGAQTCLTRSIPKLLSGFTIRLASLLAIRVEPSLR
jgi:hypothetical protein